MATQRETNPFVYSDSNKRYYTYDYYLKTTFGRKVARVPIDGGFTCPNIDGTCGTGGCIYCAGGSSAALAPEARTISEQYRAGAAVMAAKWRDCAFIPYFQSYTGTYAPLERLRALYEEAVALPGAVGLAIGTRADCITPEIASYLADLSARTHLTVELGLQSASDETARRIRRGHDWATFVRGYELLRAAGGRIRIGIHLILGLPGETEADMVATARAVAALRPDEVKLHLLHVLDGTALAADYRAGEYEPLEQEEYVRLVCLVLRHLPPETVIGRVTGDGAADALLAPRWSLRKTAVINEIDKAMYNGGWCQGDLYKKMP